MQVRGWGPPAAASAGACTLALPWLRTGTTRRSAFRVVTALRGAGLLTHTPAKAFFAAIAVLPGLAGAAWVLRATGYRRVAAASAMLAGALLLGCALVVRHVARSRATGAVAVAAVAGAGTVVVGLVSACRKVTL